MARKDHTPRKWGRRSRRISTQIRPANLPRCTAQSQAGHMSCLGKSDDDQNQVSTSIVVPSPPTALHLRITSLLSRSNIPLLRSLHTLIKTAICILQLFLYLSQNQGCCQLGIRSLQAPTQFLHINYIITRFSASPIEKTLFFCFILNVSADSRCQSRLLSVGAKPNLV